MHPSSQRNTVFTNLDHQYEWATDYAAYISGYKNPESMLGTTVFDLKAPVVEIADLVHQYNKRVIKTEAPSLTFDVSGYTGGLKWCITKKSPAYDEEKNLIGFYTESQNFDHTEQASPFITELYENAILIDKAKHFTGVLYEIVDCYDLHGLNEQASKVLFLMAHGKSMKKIASMIHLSPRTIEFYVEQIKITLKLKSREQLIEYAIYTNLIHKIPSGLVNITH